MDLEFSASCFPRSPTPQKSYDLVHIDWSVMMFLVFLYFLFDIYLRPQIVLDLYFLYDALDNNISPHVYMYGYDLNWTINDVYIMILNMFVFFLQENNVIISHCYRYSHCNHTHNFPKITNEVEVGSISVQREWEPGVISIRIIYWDMRKNSVSPIERNSRTWKWWKRSKCQQKGEKSQSRKELAFRFFCLHLLTVHMSI